MSNPSEEGPDALRARRAHDRRPRLRRRRANAIIDWIDREHHSAGEYLVTLIESDRALREALGERLPGEGSRAGLALTLFVDFARDHFLSLGELALLLENPAAQMREALDYLVAAATRETLEGPACPEGEPGGRRALEIGL